eukprot:CAMPEP_0204863496 /NCGR_PEP_ID=MMETSP1348-20121228/3354_1 /ASSEMBLY_ACC=CAM_ASM_000700 /TAXON_ID=215587 /ORGANISM="Aplanochytrium stocchinoi, Strain GSBS06" /LENGTH=570 /DNA_ID=CAMNT_0052013835 /DNA_START=95 /DNA_END=1807 /DNA_ORIENTATION=+
MTRKEQKSRKEPEYDHDTPTEQLANQAARMTKMDKPAVEVVKNESSWGEYNLPPSKNLMLKKSKEIHQQLKNKYTGLKNQLPYYASRVCDESLQDDRLVEVGFPARYCLREVEDMHSLDFSQNLNTSSYVNVVAEPEEEEVALMGLKVNLADQTVYPASFRMHNKCVNIVANLWNCPKPKDFDNNGGTYAGAGTVGSTEACLLSGLALKFRWRKWYARKYNKSEEEVLSIRPNLVISTLYQAAWEKLFKYFDIIPKFVRPSYKEMKIDPEKVGALIDEHTMGVVCIMGNHYSGHYDRVDLVDAIVEKVNKEKGLEVGIHVDAASGGFVAPFQEYLPPWDFRLKNVMSISASGHKFGEAVCGTGWLVWRQKERLAEHVAISVSYLGGHADSYTLNFSRPAAGLYSQMYKFFRLGREGYTQITENMMAVAKYIRDEIKGMKGEDGVTPLFEILDDGDKGCLPVVAAMLNPDLHLPFDDVDLQYALVQGHWYVSGYAMAFEHPTQKTQLALFHDQVSSKTMFRIVVKSNLTIRLAEHLVETFHGAIKYLFEHGEGYSHFPHKQVNLKRSNYVC